MKCTLHIGTAKTGTTSVQKFFHRNRSSLLDEYGILYPQFESKFRTGASHRALSYYAAGEKLLSDQKWNIKSAVEKQLWESDFQKSFRLGMKNGFQTEFIDRIRHLLNKTPRCEHYFLSSEHLHSRITTETQVERIVNLLSEFFDEINLVIFLKPQSSLAVSRYSTVLKSGKANGNIFKSFTEQDTFYNYHKFLSWWGKLIGDQSITIRIIDDRASQTMDAVEEMCSIIGIDGKSLPIPATRNNVHLNVDSLDFLYILNQYLLDNNLNVSFELRKRIIRTLENIGSSDRKLPAQNSAILFDELYGESNYQLAKKFNLLQPLFHVDYSKYPLTESAVTFVKVQDVFNGVAQQISVSCLNKNDQISWGEFNHFFISKMKTNKISSDYGPDFACIGFPKCATTFILKRFAEYSFDTLVNSEFPTNNLDEYRPKIKEIHEQGRKVAIKDPNIIFNAGHINEILRSGCKVIVSLRNPVRWLKSFYNYRLKRIDQGLEQLPPAFDKIPTFNDIVNNNIEFMGVSVKQGMMAKIITENLLKNEHYDPSRVHFVIQEEFEAEHDKVQTELLDFLNIPISMRKKRRYKFDYEKPNRWNFFNEDNHDADLYKHYSNEIKDICSLVNSLTGKDLKSIWGKFYDIKIGP